MTVTDYILLISAIIIVIGWFVNSYLDRRHEIYKKRIDHRLEMLKKHLLFYIKAQKHRTLDGFNEIQVLFYLYGYNDEIELIKKITSIVTENPDNTEWLMLLGELNNLVKDRLRIQLGLPKSTI